MSTKWLLMALVAGTAEFHSRDARQIQFLIIVIKCLQKEQIILHSHLMEKVQWQSRTMA